MGSSSSSISNRSFLISPWNDLCARRKIQFILCWSGISCPFCICTSSKLIFFNQLQIRGIRVSRVLMCLYFCDLTLLKTVVHIRPFRLSSLYSYSKFMSIIILSMSCSNLLFSKKFFIFCLPSRISMGIRLHFVQCSHFTLSDLQKWHLLCLPFVSLLYFIYHLVSTKAILLFYNYSLKFQYPAGQVSLSMLSLIDWVSIS